MNTSMLARWLAVASAAVGSIAVLLLMVHTLANVFMRQFFNSPVLGTLEYVGYWYLPAVAFFGYLVAKTRNEHIDAPLVFDRLTRKDRRTLSLLNSILVVLITLLFTYFTFGEAVEGFEISQTAGASTITVWPVLFIVPLVFSLFALLVIVDLVKVICSGNDSGERDESQDLAGDSPSPREALS